MTLHRITRLDDLHAYLHTAMQLEHATIPPYLTALYSIRPQTNADATRVIRVVAVEEMLHLTLVANVLNAVGGTPDLTADGFVPTYPAHLPDGETDFEVSTQAFSPAAIETFLKIERPAVAGADEVDRDAVVAGGRFVDRERSSRALLPTVAETAVPEDVEEELHFYSIGEFYLEIAEGIRRLHAEMGDALFSGDPARQVGPDYYYSGGGALVPVVDLESAEAALELISEQGEGLGGAIYDEEGELSHFYRFQQLLLGRYYQPGDESGAPSGPSLSVDWDAVYPVATDPRLEDHPEGSDLHGAVLELSDTYGGFLQLLTDAFTGQPQLLQPAVGEMFRIKEFALQIMRQPMPDRPGVHAAPIFQPRLRTAVS